MSGLRPGVVGGSCVRGGGDVMMGSPRHFRWRNLLSPLWSNRWWGLFHGPRPLRAFSAWVLPHWYGDGE